MNNRFKELRKTLNISQEAIGENLGIKRSAVSLIESGKSNLTEKNILLICKTFNVNEEWLRTGKGEMFNTTNNLIDLFAYKIEELQGDEQQFLINFLSMNKKDRHETLKFMRRLIGK